MYGQLCAEFYDADKKFAPTEEIAFYRNIFNKTDLILEPMCCSGRLLIPLLREGYQIHGVDNSSAMIKSCEVRAERFNITPILFTSTIENLSLPYKYDGIIIPLGSFQLFYPRTIAFKVLEVFHQHLKPKGKLVFDLFVPWESLYEHGEEELTESEVKINEHEIIKNKSHNIVNKKEQFILSSNQYTKIINGKTMAKEQEQMHLCWYYRYEMELILEKYSFPNIIYQERMLNNYNHMSFIAEKGLA